MDAKPLLVEVGRSLRLAKLEAVLIGNAAAALRGAPVTTIDFDFFFRKNPRTLRKLRAFADVLSAAVLRPYYPASDLFRVVRDDDGLQVDFMARIHGVRSYEGVRDRAQPVVVDGESLLVATLDDIIRSKRAANRPRDRAVIELLESAREEASKGSPPRRPRQRR
jgi:hypothetical protein